MAQKPKKTASKPRSFADLPRMHEDPAPKAAAAVPERRKAGKGTATVPIVPARSRVRPSSQRNRRGGSTQWGKLALFVALVVIVAGVAVGLTRKNAMIVSLGETAMGTIKKENITAEDIQNTVESLLATEMGTQVHLTEAVGLTPVHAKKAELVTLDSVVAKLKAEAGYQVLAAGIQVNGATVTVVVNKEQAETLLQEIIDEYVPAGVELESAGFTQDVQVVEQFVDAGDIVSAETARAKLTAGTATDKTYTVATGNTLYGIATSYDMTLEEIQEKNPGVTPETLRAGQALTVTVMTPYLSVKTVENQTYVEKQAKSVEYRTDSSLASGVSKVIQQGKDGQKEVVTQIIRINGFVEEEKEVSATITQEPVTEIIAVGP